MGNGQGNANNNNNNQNQEERDVEAQEGAYRYPPPAEAMYFGNHFMMGGQDFPAMVPEGYLFGEMADLNFLAPVPGVAQPAPPNIRHTNTVRALANIRKDSVKLIRHFRQDEPLDEYHVEFVFDSDAPCTVTLYYFAELSMDRHGKISMKSKNSSFPTSKKLEYEAGVGLVFSHPEESIRGLHSLSDSVLLYTLNSTLYPLVIQIEVSPDDVHAAQNSLLASSQDTPPPNADPRVMHSHFTIATFDRSGSNILVRPLVQSINVNGLLYILKEIYGIEPKQDGDENDEPADDSHTECVVCMSAPKDTMVLPCRHLCLCNPCAEVLRYQSSRCPICRAPFTSLLQLLVAQKLAPDETPDAEVDQRAPPGYKTSSVVTALHQQNSPQGILSTSSLPPLNLEMSSPSSSSKPQILRTPSETDSVQDETSPKKTPKGEDRVSSFMGVDANPSLRISELGKGDKLGEEEIGEEEDGAGSALDVSPIPRAPRLVVRTSATSVTSDSSLVRDGDDERIKTPEPQLEGMDLPGTPSGSPRPPSSSD